MDTAPPQPEPGRGRRFRARRGDDRRAPQDSQRPTWRDSRHSRWLLASTGLMLLVVAIVMMACGAQPSRAQTTPVLRGASPWPVLLYSPGAGDDTVSR